MNNLKQLRTSAGLSLEGAAEAMGYSVSGYLKLERGERKLNEDSITRAAKVFNVSETKVVGSISNDHRDRPVAVRLSKDQAERISLALSDILCWCRGYCAGASADPSLWPPGIESARDINIAIKGALEDFEKEGNHVD